MNTSEATCDPIYVRVTTAEREQLETVAQEQGVSRSRVARDMMRLGLSFARYGHTVNVTRAALLLEAVFATCELILEREHGDVKEDVLATANARFDELHANA